MSDDGFKTPYLLGDAHCHNRQQLAQALARDWREGLGDLHNNQLMIFFRDIQQDKAAVRLMLDSKFEQKLTADLQLLKLIVYLAPAIPPVWQGEPVSVPAVLARAEQALKEDGRDAAQWLDLIHRERVLEQYAEAGNAEMASLLQRWSDAYDQFSAAWHAMLPLVQGKTQDGAADGEDDGSYADVAEMHYGEGGPTRPSLPTMHARLLALAYDAAWPQRLRQRLEAELATLLEGKRWLQALGDPQAMDGAGLLALEALMPEARKAAQRRAKAAERRLLALQFDLESKWADLERMATAIHACGTPELDVPALCVELEIQLDAYFSFNAQIRASNRTDAPWQELRKATVQRERAALDLQRMLEDLMARRAVTSGWMAPRPLIIAVLATLLLTAAVGPQLRWLPLVVTLAVVGWRLGPDMVKARKIRELAARF